MMEALITVLGAGLMAVTGWAFMISNRVAVLESEKVGLKELIDTKLSYISRRLDRIEEKLNR